jgi:putative heme iron utilization protein
MSTLSPDAIAAMTQHMNEDHADSIAAYARHYGGYTDVKAAKIVDFDPLGIVVEVETPTGAQTLRIPFDHELADADDGRRTLIEMAKAASR